MRQPPSVRGSTFVVAALLAFVSALAPRWVTAAPSAPPGAPQFRTIREPARANVAAAFSRRLYLNRCDGDCVITPGTTNSSTDRSGIVSATSQLTAFQYDDAVWAEIVTCVGQIFAPFNLDVTTLDPGASAHMEVMVAGLPGELESYDNNGNPGPLDDNVLGVAPWTCGYIDSSLSYVFANAFDNFYDSDGRIINEVCAAIGQEVAHTWGLEHERLASDPMTYMSYNARRSFKDQAVSCGEYQARPCECGGNTQNSFQAIRSLFGAGSPVPPELTIVRPADQAIVQPGFTIEAEVGSEPFLDNVALFIDGTLVVERTLAPWAFRAPDELDLGPHQLEVRATDRNGVVASQSVMVNLAEPCAAAAECDALSPGLTCVDGRCVAGPSQAGGLGTACDDDAACVSGQCGSDGANRYCVEGCDPGDGDCPDGFGCLPTSDQAAVCWPGAPVDEPAGCCATGRGGPAWPIGASIAFLAWWKRPRRRRGA